MEKIKNEENKKKLSSSIKNKFFKGYKMRSKTNTDYFIPKINENINFYQTFDKSSNNLNEESYNSFQNNKKNPKNSRTSYNDLKHLNIQHLSRDKKDDYNNTLNKLFFTTSNIIKHKKNKLQNDLLVNSYYNMNFDQNDIREQNRILNKLFPDKDEMNKYSDVPFFSLMKRRVPLKMKLNLGFNKKKYKIKQEEFLYKISHNDSNEKFNFNINKGIKKGTTIPYFHGVDKFCKNNKISKTNFPLKESLKKNKFNLELDVENITKGGEKTSQMSNKEKRLKMIENNVNNIKSIPSELVNDLEDEVFKLLDEEFDKNYSIHNEECQTDKKKEEMKDNVNTELKPAKNKKEEENKKVEEKDNINNLNIEFISNKSRITNNRNDNNNYINPNIMKRPNKYPINFYTTQQIRKKEHFSTNSKITFEERIKMLKKQEQKEKEEKNLLKFKNGLNLENVKDMKLKKSLDNKIAYKRQCKIRDILIGNKLKSTYDEVDTKRILNGLKPWIYIRADEKKQIDLDKLKQKLNEDIKNIL